MVDFGKLPKGTIGDARRGLIVRFGKKEGQYPRECSKRLFRGVKGLSEVKREIRPHSGGCRFSLGHNYLDAFGFDKFNSLFFKPISYVRAPFGVFHVINEAQ